MKATKILAAAAALLLVFSCKEGNLENNGPSAGSNTPITLKADNVYPVMNQDTQTEDVLELSWNATTNMGSGARIEYILMIDRKGGNFESAYEIPLGVNTLKRSFTAGELNDILMDELGYDADEAIELDVCILAIIRNNLIADVVSNSLTITFTTFVPKLTSLYLIGDATTSLWELGNAIAMMPIPGEEGGFSWSGELGMGEIKFVTSLEEWVPSYGQGVEEGTLYLRTKMWEDESESIETEDPKIKISDPGTYRITVNIETMTYSMVKTGGPKYYNMYLTGTSVGETLEMFRVGYAFVKGVELQKGDLYFSVEPDDSGDHYWAATENQAKTYNWGEGFAPVEARLMILSALEELTIKESRSVMLIADGGGSFLGAKFSYFSEDEHTFMGFGGLRYIEVNYTDAEWAEYVAANNNDLSAEYKKSE